MKEFRLFLPDEELSIVTDDADLKLFVKMLLNFFGPVASAMPRPAATKSVFTLLPMRPAPAQAALTVSGKTLQMSGNAIYVMSPQTLTHEQILVLCRRILYAALLPEALRGEVVLVHGAAVIRDGRCVLLCGRSGVGKSTAALRLAQDEWLVPGDDTLLLARANDGSFVAQGLPTWSRFLDDKENTSYDCALRGKVSEIFMLDRGAGCREPLSLPEARQGLMCSFFDLWNCHLPGIEMDIRRKLWDRAHENAKILLSMTTPERLSLNMQENLTQLIQERHHANQSLYSVPSRV